MRALCLACFLCLFFAARAPACELEVRNDCREVVRLQVVQPPVVQLAVRSKPAKVVIQQRGFGRRLTVRVR
jgi:hypothetical protein